MQHPLPDLGEWPVLEWEQWKDTAETLHMYMQIVGKARLGLTPIQNHWWNMAFYLTARGLTTSAMPADHGRSLDIEFELLSHEVVCRTSDGDIRKVPLRPISVAQFFDEFTRTLESLGISTKIDPMPVEVANPIRCDIDTVHCSYDRDTVTHFLSRAQDRGYAAQALFHKLLWQDQPSPFSSGGPSTYCDPIQRQASTDAAGRRCGLGGSLLA